MRISARVFGCLNPPVRLKHGRIDPFAISRFYGSGVRKPVTVVTSDLLRGRSASDSEETAKPETEQPAAVKPLCAKFTACDLKDIKSFINIMWPQICRSYSI
jgi:hypothetical protein